MRWDRVVAVSGAAAGSGYLIAPRLVLTSAHVTGPGTDQVTVFRPGRAGRFTATVAWCGTAGARTDAALVVVTAPDWPDSQPGPVVWGRTVTHEPGIRCVTWGLPEFVQRAGAAAEVEQPTGTINPGDGYIGDRYIVKLDGHPPDDGTGSPWRGISGAAVFCGDLLTAVVATGPAHRGHAALAAVPVSLLLREPGFLDIAAGHGVGVRWEPVELQELMDLQSPLRATPARTPAGLLTARRAVVPFHGREQLLAELRSWAAEPGPRVWLLHGPGGQGKTRLAHYFGEELAEQGWAVLWLDPRAGHDRLRPLARVAEAPLLVVVDYAETRTDQLADLLDTLAGTTSGVPVKVVLLARVTGEWQEQAAGSDPAAELLHQAHTTALEPLDTTATAQQDTYRAAVRAFAAALPRLDTTGPGHDGWTVAAETVTAGPIPEFGPAATVLGVQMAALVTLLDATTAGQPAQAARRGELEDQLLAHERRYWDTTAIFHGVAVLGPAVVKDLIAATAVLNPQTYQDLDTVLARIPDLADQSTVLRGRVRGWLMSLYPGQAPGVFAGLAPDRVAERLVGRLVLDPARPCLIEILATGGTLTETETDHLLTVCVRAATHPALTPGVSERITAWCTRHPDTLMPAAIRIATRVEAPDPLLAAVDQLTTDPHLGIDTLNRIHNSLPRKTRILLPAAVSVTRALTAHHRRISNPTPEDQSRLATGMNNLAVRLGDLGRREDALAAAVEAVEIRRRLAATDPDTYLPDLAMSVHNLAVRLNYLGRREEALIAVEAVEIWRRLAAADPDAYLPDLAAGVNNLAVYLGGLGRREEALATAAEAVEIRRRLAATDPDTYLPDLAMSVHNLANRLSYLGRREEALTAATEAVDIRRRLAAADPDAYLPDLTTSVNNLAVRLGDMGRREEGLTAATEAVDIYRRLAAANPAAYLPDLAMSVHNLANRLGDLGDREGALAAAVEAGETYRRLATANPDAYLPDLATSVHNLAIRLGDMGRREEGLTAATEAVEIRRRLAAVNPDAYLLDLAAGVHNLAIRLGDVGRRDEGLAAATEAVDIYRRLAAINPDAYLPNLAAGVNDLAIRLGDVGRPEEGLTAATEAVDIYRRLTAANPDAYSPNLAAGVHNLGNRLGDVGRREEGLTAATEAVDIYRRLAAANPDAYSPNLAAGVHNLGNRLGDVGRPEEGLTAATEAVDIYRRLAAANAAAHLPNLAASVNNLAIRLGDVGRRQEGSAAAAEAVETYRQLAARYPLAYSADLARAERVLAILQE
ncbi:tetratricopeptide repeat protein [Nocardia sp. BMG111209]|uniref:tetratricopeptide repeat protein n=1 Tax=Nocardia sp. BMG111209 TaxID=1160137 RepID=UPI000364AD02|nr:tetratricopeptide repeat protein [Nocardia sp. BMG111209]